MTRMILPAITALIAMAFLTGSGLAAHITIGDVVVNNGGTATANIILDSVPQADGIAGYRIDISVANPAVCQVTGVTFSPTLGGLSESDSLPFTNGFIHWADTDEKISPGSTATNIVLATVTLKGLSTGSTTLGTSIETLDGDGPNWADLQPASSISNPTITVTSSGTTVTPTTGPTPLALPGLGQRPASPGNDGKFQDLDGDGSITSADVSLYFTDIDWMQQNEPAALFDFNGNGAIDFGDIVLLHDRVG